MSGEAGALRTSNMKVLVADDSPTDLRLAQRCLEKWGYQAVTANNGDDALDRLRDPEIRVAILDWMMPGIDGVELCQKVQELDHFVYAILVTGRSDAEDVIFALEKGASDYIVKPYKTNQLRARLRVGERIVSMQTQFIQAQRLTTIGGLAAGIAHEINTPIQYMGDNIQFLGQSFQDLLGLVGRCKELFAAAESQQALQKLSADFEAALEEADFEYVSEEVPRAIAQVEEGARRVSGIVSVMKEFAQPPGAENKDPTDVNRAVENTVAVARAEWSSAADMELDLDPSLPPVPCYSGPLNQALLNLVVNAAQTTREAVDAGRFEKGTIRIQTRVSGGAAEILIGDTGMGISKEIQERIFDPFFTTKAVGSGTGQGLAIAHSAIVDKHGGSIAVESQVGQGSTFILRLPIGADS